MDMRQTSKDVFHIAFLAALVLGLLVLLTWTGVLRCSVVPGWCDAYWLVISGGPPRVLIVEGSGGMGDPVLLQDLLRDPQHAKAQVTIARLDFVNLGNIKEYDLVIVERARRMSTGNLKMFMEYVNAGGRLVWTGDAGVELTETDQWLYADEDPAEDTNEHVPVHPWRRKEFGRVVAFDDFLAVRYQARYCELKTCISNAPWQGLLHVDAARDHRLVYGLREGLVLRGDFAIVTPVEGVPSTRVMTLGWESHLIANDGRDFGQSFPIIQASGVGDRVAYYAVPPEQFAAPDLPEKYFTLVENLYYGMLR